MLYSALILGLISSMHCIGMCGPIAMMLPVDHKNPAKKATQILTYHAGRLIAYGTLGLVFGCIGKGFYLAGLQQQLFIVAGTVMILIAMVPEKKLSKYNFSKPAYKLISNIKTSLGNQFRKKSYNALFTIGFLNGLLPCGLVYAALFGALAMQNTVYSAAYMLLYGAGTIPLMSTVVYASGMFKNPLRAQFAKVVPYAAVLIGMLFIVRGLALGIPYLSPSNVSLFGGTMADCK
ncbi:sulfite exporter TauE/SafE family protein [Flavobacterium psychrotrophum]|uniref:sulfite exporter TauE/SafE family protein n=1 Tax=Flavobacterium psychrotrophum TaxID=2294119 RepID=UPI000E314AB5|nr:sulfite exporter TauE/SafE family protein [Flavobacterium psychrotrophum]